MNSETENAPRTSADSDSKSKEDQAATGPKASAREESSSLQMLEESAAQLAALRQRAEYLLEQMSTGSGASSSSESQDSVSQDPASPSGDQTRPYSAFDRNDGSDPGSLNSSEPEQNSPAVPNTSATDLGQVEHGGREEGSTPRTQSSPLQDVLPDSDSAHQIESLNQSPTVFDQPIENDQPHSQPGLGPPSQPEPQQQQFPIQNFQPQSESLLDSPVSVAPPPERLMFEVAPESLTEDAQLVEEEILNLYEAIDRFRETRRENTGHALSLLREAREIISSQPNRIERAQYNIQQARQIIERARISRRRSRGIALRTFTLLIVWLAGLGGLGAALYLYPLDVNKVIGTVSSSTGWNTSHYYPLLWTVAAGGIGGWLGTISFLFERMRVHEEFDRLYILRSFVQPLMGVVLGLTTYGLLAALFNSVNASIIGHPVTSFLPAAAALPIGIWQVYVYAAIFRVTSLLSFQRRRRW
ncbi:MAG: hypothetical protein OXI80_09780 [Caldilineaceae bacterium]|nr:hypothetical protein [Caldilineaceae bacterium]MDE0337946.1 hypothetical protein [Caldilineaceae bacterium]